MKDLDEFKPGDRVQVSYTEEIIMMTEREGEGTAAVAKYGVADVTPQGENPPALTKVDTSVVTGKILSVDPKRRRLTFEDPEGKKRSLKLSRKIKDKDLEKFKPGETLNMAITDELAVEVVK